MVCNKPLEPPHQRLCSACRTELQQALVKQLGGQLGGEENLQKLLSWPKEEKKEAKG